MNNIENIQQISSKYILLLNALILAVPAGTLLYWLFFNSLSDGFLAELPVLPNEGLSSLQIILAVLVSFIPMSVGLYTLITLRILFTLYESGVIFSVENVTCFRRLGYALIAWVIANMLFTPLISLVLSFANAPGNRNLVMNFGIEDISTLIIGGVVLIVAWVMNEGHKLQDEQTYTV